MIKIIKEVDKDDLKKFMYEGFQDCADDPRLYECLNSGKSINVFQMSGGTASQVVNQIKPRNLLEMTACNAFARPGTINGVSDYINGKSGDLKYSNKIINSVFGETFGVCLYQESIMKVVELLSPKKSGSVTPVYNGNFARGLLKKLGKANKKQEDIDSWNNMVADLKKNASSLGIPDSEIKMLVDDMLSLANYSFNKSHALAYSMMAAWTLYLNVYMSNYYYPAVIEYAFGHDKETLDTLKTMRKNGYDIIKPDINLSKSRTYSEDNKIFIGLHNLKQVGSAADGICSRAPYHDFSEFLDKNLTDSKVNKRALTALIEFGCFDELENTVTRHQMITIFNKLWEEKPTIKKISESDAKKIENDEELRNKLIGSIKSKIDETINNFKTIRSIAENSPIKTKDDRNFLKDCEIKYLGFNFFVSPFDGEINNIINDKISKKLCIDGFEKLREKNDMSKIVPVFISHARYFNDKNGNEMAFLTLEDRNGDSVTVPIFASVLPYISDKIADGLVALMLLYNTEDTYRGGTQIMFGTKKRVDAEKMASFIIPLKRESI